jgi:L-fuculose-phosphate aldolase
MLHYRRLRKALIATACATNSLGLNQGTAGNVSARTPQGFLITPSGLPFDQLVPEHVVEMDLEGRAASDPIVPSSEWRFHRDILVNRPEVGAVLHAHSPYATALACAHREIPAFHYMVAVAGGKTIPCAPYAAFGTQALSDNVLAALENRHACLLANHGMVAVGPSLEAALRLAKEVEELARQYHLSLQIGGPVILSDEAMTIVLEKFKTYGRRERS